MFQTGEVNDIPLRPVCLILERKPEIQITFFNVKMRSLDLGQMPEFAFLQQQLRKIFFFFF